ncbi:30S ribosomal protein S9 [Candidatus Woesearchaeota archaeon]|nr:30S ribosomal protein S9 [Candidatus Woesearchaeota archaeon]
MSKPKTVNTTGRRKRSIARAVLIQGKGMVRINGQSLDTIEPRLVRMKLREPLMLAGDVATKVHIDVNVNGGGIMSQADAARLAISRALAAAGGEKIRQVLLNYDRAFLVADTRRKEQRKPNDSKARAKRQKSYR